MQSTHSTNWMLDQVTETLQKFGIDNPELASILTAQKIEYGRRCISQIISKGGLNIQSYKSNLDNQLKDKIIEVGQKPVEILQ